MPELSLDELLFFNKREGALPLYEALKEAIFTNCGQTTIQVKKSQISFVNRHLFGAVSFTAVRRANERPNPYLTVTFGLPYRLTSPRIDAAVEAYPNRWTHHILIGTTDEIDAELLSWLRAAADFSNAKL